jgi:predicted transcriptional regulator
MLINHSRHSRSNDILDVIRRLPGVTKQQIIAETSVHKTTAEKRLKSLLRQGVIARERETRPPDSRVRARWLYRLADSASAA